MSRRFRAPSPAFVLALVAVVLSATGLAVAAIPDSKGVIHSCYSKSDGSLRLVKASKCQKGEKKLKWNQQGRPGTRGSRGLRGAQGPPGPTFGAAGEGISGQVTDPPASPDESSADATNYGRHFDFTLPRSGNIYIRFFTSNFGVTCSAAPLAQAGLYVDGKPVPNTSDALAPSVSATAEERVAVLSASAGPHSAEVRYDCSGGDPGASNQNNNPTWTVLLLGT